MKKKLIIIICLIIIFVGICFIIFNDKDKKGFYTLKDDNIKDITSVVGERHLSSKDKNKSGENITKTYNYTSIEDPSIDISNYITYLQNKSNFIPTKSFNLNDETGSIQLARYSTNKDYIIIMDIKYTKNSYTIKITRGKGKIDSLNNF